MVELLLQAAARVLARESLAGFTTNRVAEVAGVSVGSLYQYFPNKDALTAALVERAHAELAEAVEATLAATAGQPLQATVRALAQLAVRQQYGQAMLAAALDHEERRLPLERRLREHDARLAASVQRLLDRHASVIDPALPAAAAFDLLVLTRALVESAIGRPAAERADLEDRVVRALLGYLLPRTMPASRTRRSTP
jgi:AcrR family transcriptional regulator